MPHISGGGLLLQSTADYLDIPIILMTATNDLDTAVQCMRSGAIDYLVKPVEKNRLVSSVMRALEICNVADRIPITAEREQAIAIATGSKIEPA